MCPFHLLCTALGKGPLLEALLCTAMGKGSEIMWRLSLSRRVLYRRFHCSESPLLAISIVSRTSKRHRSHTWDPTPLPVTKKRPHTPRGHTPRGHTPRLDHSGHQRSQTSGFPATGADLALPRKEREDFRKALVNLVMSA